MRHISPVLLGLSLAVFGSSISPAQQDAASSSSMPKVLQITREFVKPGKAGMTHDKSEGVFVAAFQQAKWPTHYVALTSLSGKSRALYFTPYPSFDAWEKDTAAQAKNASLSAALDKAIVSDGDLLDGLDQAVAVYSEEMSYHAKPDLSHARFLDLSVYHVRPGHQKDWSDLVKLVISGYQKAGTPAHWAMFNMVYGRPGGDYLVLSSKASMTELDAEFGDKNFEKALGEEGMKKLSELEAASVDTIDHELFAISPHQSYVDDAWIKADPDFWGPKPATGAAESAMEEKPAKP